MLVRVLEVDVTHVYNDQKMDSVFSDPETWQFGKEKIGTFKSALNDHYHNTSEIFCTEQ